MKRVVFVATAIVALLLTQLAPDIVAQPTVVVGFVFEYHPTWGGEGTTLTINYRARLIGTGVPDKQMDLEGVYFEFDPQGANPINQLENALVDSLVAEAAARGVTLARTATFIPTYKRGN